LSKRCAPEGEDDRENEMDEVRGGRVNEHEVLERIVDYQMGGVGIGSRMIVAVCL
jgi:hypothetical protein